MTKEEVRAYLRTYCNIDLKEEYCTLENVLNLIPDVDNAVQKKAFSDNAQTNKHCFEPINGGCLNGDLIISRYYNKIWMLNWGWIGITGVLPQGKDLMTAALSMCEFCVVNGIRLNIKNLKNNI